jgi:aryl-alcohol dehydrogenase-like predicted oxidoreductase
MAFLGPSKLPCSRIVCGLWQTSGGWGSATEAAAIEAIARLARAGHAFDGADHYGPSEQLMGAVREQLGAATPSFFTKWCPQPRRYSPVEVDAAIGRSLSRMRTPKLDLLQFHWWDYAMRAELEAALRDLQRLQAAGRIRELALTNFDTQHVVWMVDELRLPIAANQVQFSLVDQRPLRAMAPACAARGVQLLCYGTLLGGLLSDAWLGKPAPTPAELPTPSQRKYYNMLRAWGSWALFQELLAATKAVGSRHGVSVAVVGLAWVLAQPAVAGCIVGLRAGLSEHNEENAAALRVALTAADFAQLAAVTAKGADLFSKIGDCGDEYRG